MIRIRNIEEIKNHLEEAFNDESKMRVLRSWMVLVAILGVGAFKALTPVDTGDLGGRIR